ncbi:MAG TPA: gamma carbonic anhydrase family protein [Pseudomonadales bacterium]|nr:gamma carbonic anhydrase family protein [Pseudomonadales bacterium]
MSIASSNIRPYLEYQPQIAERVLIDSSAVVIGNVSLHDDVSVWPLCVLRGDVNRIVVGPRSNIQDGTVIHVSRPKPNLPDGWPTLIGADVTIAHKVMLHGCTIEDRVLVGMGAIIMDGVHIASDVIVAAGALVPPGKHLASGYVYSGSPAKASRPLREEEKMLFLKQSANYVTLKDQYLNA